jgi:hypothetical protein
MVAEVATKTRFTVIGELWTGFDSFVNTVTYTIPVAMKPVMTALSDIANLPWTYGTMLYALFHSLDLERGETDIEVITPYCTSTRPEAKGVIFVMADTQIHEEGKDYSAGWRAWHVIRTPTASTSQTALDVICIDLATKEVIGMPTCLSKMLNAYFDTQVKWFTCPTCYNRRSTACQVPNEETCTFCRDSSPGEVLLDSVPHDIFCLAGSHAVPHTKVLSSPGYRVESCEDCCNEHDHTKV